LTIINRANQTKQSKMDPEMQAAYQAFMLGNKSKKTKGNNDKNASTPTKVNTNISHKRTEGNSSSSVGRKGYRPILKAFQGRLQEWSDTNKQLKSVLGSIINLRDRIYWESSQLQALSVTNDHQEEKQPTWKTCGFRYGLSNQGSSSCALHMEDINLALNHDLLQHERMLSVLRSLTALLAQNVDEIGRRLDEWMILNLSDLPPPSHRQQQQYNVSNDNDESIIAEERLFIGWTKEQNVLEDARIVYSFLALDLFRKQKVATDIFDSCHDSILKTIDDDNFSKDSFWKTDPRDVVKKGSKEWSGPDNKDCLNLVQKLLNVP
jgi:hypothetical protein